MRNVANLVPPYEPDGQYHATSSGARICRTGSQNPRYRGYGQDAVAAFRRLWTRWTNHSLPEISSASGWGMLRSTADQIPSTEILTQSERQTALERVSIRNSIANLKTFPCIRILEEKRQHAYSRCLVRYFSRRNCGLWTANRAILFVPKHDNRPSMIKRPVGRDASFHGMKVYQPSICAPI